MVKKNLVFGKAVQIRHYPVTVNAEGKDKAVTTGGESYWEGRSGSTKRKSGDRPGLQGLRSAP